MWKRLLPSATTVALIVAAPLPAQTAPSPQAEVDKDIVVQARRREVVRSYIRRMARPELRRQIARWNMPLCVKYEGMDARYSMFIQQRMTQVAKQIGAKIAEPRCSFNVLVTLTDHANVMAKALAHMRPTRIGSLSNAALPPRRDIAAIEEPRVIRWMTATETVTPDGVSFGSRPENKPVNTAWIDSFIHTTTREDVRSKIVVIDAVRLRNVTLDQLADYITFVVLAAPDITADFSGTDSIMALFASTPSLSQRMTRQDLSYLTTLYSVPMDRPVDVQSDLLLTRMMKPSAETSSPIGD